jgi:anti-anti-sigma regulatory factor
MSVGTVTVTPCDADGTWLIELRGDHDLATRAVLEEQTSVIWPFCRTVVIDLSEATFVDSGVIRWLLSAERQLEAANAFTLSIVVGPPGCVAARLCDLLRMRFVMACFATRAQAFDQAPVRAAPRVEARSA